MGAVAEADDPRPAEDGNDPGSVPSPAQDGSAGSPAGGERTSEKPAFRDEPRRAEVPGGSPASARFGPDAGGMTDGGGSASAEPASAGNVSPGPADRSRRFDGVDRGASASSRGPRSGGAADGLGPVEPRFQASGGRQGPRPELERSHGRAFVSMERRDGRTRLVRLAQSGSAKAFLPRTHGDTPEIVFLNTSGGLTGGDRLSYAVDVGPGVRATVTTQTAERAYAAGGGQAEAEVALSVGADGWIDWLPQETILFRSADLVRRTSVDLAPGAGCLLLETVILGRHAMGEEVDQIRIHDLRTVRREGRPVWIDPLQIGTGTRAEAARPSILGGARAFATLALVGRGAETMLAPLRAVLGVAGVESAASAFDGRLVLRMLAHDGQPLRHQIVLALGVLRRDPLPRVWQAQGSPAGPRPEPLLVSGPP